MRKSRRTELQGADVRQVFEAVLPEEALRSLIERAGFQQRQRALEGLEFIRAMVISASRGDAGRQAAVLQSYFEEGHRPVARSSQYGWFNEALEEVMEGVRDRALRYARSLRPDLPGWLGAHVRDWFIVDSTTVQVPQALVAQYPSTGAGAALKVHKTFSVGVGTTVGYHLSPAKDHDSPHLELDESWRGAGLLIDLGYASHQRLRDCERFGVHYVLRLKENWKPKVEAIHAGAVRSTFLRGTDLDALLDEEVLGLTGAPIDAEVRLGTQDGGLLARLVGVEHKGRYYFYLTNLPRSVTPAQVADLYRVRWEIEVDNKTDKSCHQLDAIESTKGHVVRALVHASITASVLINLMAYHHRQREGAPSGRRRKRTKSPIHPQAAAKMMAVMAHRIADAMLLTGEEAQAQWDFIASRLVFMGRDPNWRRRPSVLDRLRGWIVKPGPPRRARKKGRKR